MPINRRQFIAASTVALGAVRFRDLIPAASAFSGPDDPRAQPQTPPAPVPKFEALRRNVGVFTARGGTIGWLINKDAVVVVDTQYLDTAKLCLDGLKERTGRGIDLVFNTHHHADHTGGNAVFKDAAKKIVAQTRVPDLQKQAAAQQPNSPPPVVATATFDTTWSEKMGDESVNARHYGAGHTGGDAIVHFEGAHVVHMGDLLFHQIHPRVDRPGGASIQNWITTLRTVAKNMPADTIYIAGHAKPGAPVTAARDALVQQSNYFDAVLSHVRKGMAANKSKDEIAALAALPGFENYAAAPPILTLNAVLIAAFEELSAR